MTTKDTGAPKEPAAKKRGKWPKRFRVPLILLLALLLICAAVLLYGRYTKTHYRITFYQENSQKISANIRIAVLSDLHVREYGEGNETLIGDIRALEPDLIFFAGDMVIRDEDDYGPVLDLISALTEVAPCYGVLGNHESERIYDGGDRDLPGALESAGLKLLRNAEEEIRVGRDTIRLTGLEGTAEGFDKYGGRAFMDSIETDPSVYRIVMAHIPIMFESKLSGYDFDLGIAGHVHGGIVVLPFLGGLYSDEEGFFPKYTAGEYILDGSQTLVISAGLGDSKIFPPRINNMPELVVIDINRY